MINVLTIYDHSGPKYHRCLLPMSLMNGINLTINNVITEELVSKCDILFFNRTLSTISLQTLLKWRNKYLFKIIIDYDDYWVLEKDHYLYEHYKEVGISEIMELYISNADAITCTHERLAEKIREFNENVIVLPNAIPNSGQFNIEKEPSELTRIFWAGSVTHKNDIEIIRNPVKRFGSFSNIKMVMCGFNPKAKEYKVMASAFTNGGQLPNMIVHERNVDDYYLSYSQCDISLIPLVNTRFNSYKSNLKILEAANVGAPVVVSRVHPYLYFPEDIVNYVDKSSDWFNNVGRLLNNKSLLRQQGENLKKYCEINFNFYKINEERKRFFYDIHTSNSFNR